MSECKKTSVVKYKDDQVFVPELLSQIKNENIRKRISNEICTYMTGAKKYKRRHYFFETILVALPLMVTVVEILMDDGKLESLLIVIFSIITAILGKIASYQKAYESWCRYRIYLQESKTEIFNYVYHFDKYKDIGSEKELDNLFIENMEQIFAEESNAWNKMREKEI